jgi:p-methyltransferase
LKQTTDFIRRTGLDFWRAQLWYCEANTPVQARRAEFSISGSGFDWRHATLDSDTAMDLLEEMIFEIGPEGWLPQWSFDFWALPYLLGRGLDRDDIVRFLQLANARLAMELEGVPEDDPARDGNRRAMDAFISGVAGRLTPVPQ